MLNHAFPGLVVRIVSSNEAQDFFLVGAYSDRQPPLYAFCGTSSGMFPAFAAAVP